MKKNHCVVTVKLNTCRTANTLCRLLLALVVLPSVLVAAQAPHRMLETHVCGQWYGDFPSGHPTATTVNGDYAFTMLDNGYLLAADISNPSNICFAGGVQTVCNEARALATAGDFLYVAGQGAGLLIFDISRPYDPRQKSILNMPDYESVNAVAVAGNHAYIAAGYDSFFIVDISDAAHPEIIDEIILDNESRDVVVVGDKLYLSAGFGGFYIYDITARDNPVELADCDVDEKYCGDLTIAGGYAYIGAGWGAEVVAVDISDPSDPFVVWSWDNDGSSLRLMKSAVFGDSLYLPDKYDGLFILDISAPATPALLAHIMPDSQYSELADIIFVGGNALLTDSLMGLRIIATADVETWDQIGIFVTRGDVYDVAQSGSLLCLARGVAGLQILDVTKPLAPVQVGSCLAGRYISHVVVSDDYAYVFNERENLQMQVVDISNPSNPLVRGSCTIEDEYQLSKAVLFCGKLYLSANSTLYVLDIGDPDAPTYTQVAYDDDLDVNTLATDGSRLFAGIYRYDEDEFYGVDILVTNAMGELEKKATIAIEAPIWDLAAAASNLYVLSWDGLSVLNVSDYENISVLSTMESWSVRMINLAGDYAILWDYDNPLKIIDISDPNSPYQIGFCEKPYTGGMAVNGAIIYMAAYGDGLITIDRGVPTTLAMDIVSCPEDSSRAGGIAIAGDHAFLMNGNIILAADLTQPAAPEPVGIYEAQNWLSSRDIVFNGKYMYLASEWQETGIEIVNVSDPENMQFLEQYLLEDGQFTAMAMDNVHLYAALPRHGVRILDTSDPTNLVFCAETGDFSSDKLIVNGNYLYASAYDMGLQIIDVSDTENPQWCGSIKPDNYNTISIAVSSNYVYMLDENFKQGGSETKLVAGPAPLGLYSATWMTLRVIDVSDPTDPYEVGRYRYYGYGWDLALSGDFIYIAAAEQGIIAVDISDPTEPRRVTSHRGASSAQRLAAGAQYLYVVSYDDNMRVIKLLESGGADESTTTTPVPVPHAWLDQYYDGLDNASAYESAALADQDNDGIPTWQEYVMDTDPNDDASFLRVTAIANEPSVVVVFDPASTVRDYTLLSTTNLLTGTWENVPGQGPRAGAGGADTMQDNRDIAPTRFYRIKVEVP